MPTIRRLYFYAVAFVSFELVLWGVIGLLRSIFVEPLLPSASSDALARALALILVGVPIFLVHWRWAQRAASRDPDERAAAVRAVFLYGILLSTLLPVVQNTLALLDRSLVEVAGLRATSALVGSGQTITDNLIAILLNGVAAYYFFRVARRDWELLERRESYADVRRLYRFIWVLYSLVLTVWGVQQLIRYMFDSADGVLGLFVREIFANALALLLVGAPLWVYTWQLSQSSLDEPGERESNLRLAFLYLLTLVSALTVLSAAGVLIYNVLAQAFGAGPPDFLQRVGTALSVLIPFGAVWLYYGRAYRLAIDDQDDPARQAALRRLYRYPLALAGLGLTFIGTSLLLTHLIQTAFATIVPSTPLGSQLAAALATLIAGLPLWLVMWREVQAEVRAPGDEGAHARRSLVRRAYLYFVLFAAVIGSMTAAVWLVFQVISALLGDAPQSLAQELLEAAQLLLLFAAVAGYHWTVLRRDGASTADALTERHAAFPVLVLSPDEAFAAAVTGAIARQTPDMPVTVHAADQPLAAERTDGTEAVVLPAALALHPPEALRLWLDGFDGHKVVIPQEVAGWVWSGQSPRPFDKGADQAALALRQLAEGEAIRPSGPLSPWMIVLYILAGLFALQFLLILLALLASIVAD